MGSFQGHLLPGSLFLVFGVWWAYNIFFRYFLSLRGGGSGGGGGGKNWRRRYRSTSTFGSRCCPKIPIEGILKVVVTAIGITGSWSVRFLCKILTGTGWVISNYIRVYLYLIQSTRLSLINILQGKPFTRKFKKLLNLYMISKRFLFLSNDDTENGVDMELLSPMVLLK